MGRWAQRNRRGGGGGANAPATEIIRAIKLGDFALEVDFNGHVTPTQFDISTVIIDESGAVPAAVGQLGSQPHAVRYSGWSHALVVGQTFVFNDTNSGIEEGEFPVEAN